MSSDSVTSGLFTPRLWHLGPSHFQCSCVYLEPSLLIPTVRSLAYLLFLHAEILSHDLYSGFRLYSQGYAGSTSYSGSKDCGYYWLSCITSFLDQQPHSIPWITIQPPGISISSQLLFPSKDMELQAWVLTQPLIAWIVSTASWKLNFSADCLDYKDQTSSWKFQVLGWPIEPLLEKAMAPHSSTLAWKIPWTEEPCRLQSAGSLRVGHNWATSLSLFTFLHWRKKWQATPVFLPGESQGRGSLVGCHLWGHTELDTTEMT